MIAVSTINERLALARSHVEWSRGVIDRQQQYVKELRANGTDATEKLLAAEKLLVALERTQKVFEYDLADLERRRLTLQHPR